MSSQSLNDELAELGLEPRDRAALLLVPMAAIAWADGKADMAELDAIAEKHCPPESSVREEGVLPLTEKARQFLNTKLLYQKPDEAFVARLVGLLLELLDETTGDTAVRKRDQIAGMCIDVADRSGGFLGLFGRVSPAEKKAMQDLFETLRLYEGSRAREIMRARDL